MRRGFVPKRLRPLASPPNWHERNATPLGQALTLGEPEGYVRTFVDEGEPRQELLGDYRSQLAERPRPTADDTPPSRLSPYPDSLSERELEVLRLVATGASNRDIAGELFLAVPTVKKHLSNIMGKLNATSRTQAVVETRATGLL